jgi:DNA end-binding protein Ku
MAPRPYWKGYLKLSLVSCPIALYPAIDASERVSFRQVNKKTGNHLRQQLVDFVTGEVVEAEDKGRGYEVGENQFLVVEEEELEKAREEARTRPYSAAPTGQEEAPPIAGRGAPKVEAKRSRPEPDILAPPRPRIENTRMIEIDQFVPRGQIDARYHHTLTTSGRATLSARRPLP